MQDPTLDESFGELSSTLDLLNEATERLNTTVLDFEKKLVDLAPGVSVWCPTPLRIGSPGGSHASGSLLGFQKFEDTWGLWIRRGLMKKLDNDEGYEPSDNSNLKFVMNRLGHASREDRIAAVALFPKLLACLTAAARGRLVQVTQVLSGHQGER
jgi:hypothetical protein